MYNHSRTPKTPSRTVFHYKFQSYKYERNTAEKSARGDKRPYFSIPTIPQLIPLIGALKAIDELYDTTTTP